MSVVTLKVIVAGVLLTGYLLTFIFLMLPWLTAVIFIVVVASIIWSIKVIIDCYIPPT